MDFKGQIKSAKDIFDYLHAGSATVTIRNRETGNRVTYKIKKHSEKDLWFVSYLYGADNEADYRYLGTVFNKKEFRLTKKSHADKGSIAFKAFDWVFRMVLFGRDLPECVEVWHEGRCGRCGRKLTVPESIESGYGPECIKKVSLAA
jgi:hypothetical protein